MIYLFNSVFMSETNRNTNLHDFSDKTVQKMIFNECSGSVISESVFFHKERRIDNTISFQPLFKVSIMWICVEIMNYLCGY